MPGHAPDHQKSVRPAVVLAAFGTADAEALSAILHIRDRVADAFPEREIRLAFTSGIIRRRWHTRAGDEAFRREHPEVPAEIYVICDPLSVLAALAEAGPRPVTVQSLHVSDGAEYRDLKALVNALAGIETLNPARRPFPGLALGEPALGDGSEEFLRRAAEALRPLIRQAETAGAALTLMGHGNEHLHQKVYADLETQLQKMYAPVTVGLVEGEPGLQHVKDALKRTAPKPSKILLAPLMVVAGEHAKNDLAGSGETSWLSTLQQEGYHVLPHLTGLGSLDSWADLYVEHLKKLR
ncbi:MAG: sirohydrochlorin cobaltochelatase [Candidatus Adiutrix sp.]|jgi:sirohydrochlorin cobaltochelatase|nr:sirohydrochlorin cobaltochelatase [Candidatus Adiutrix sp.]